MQCQEVCGDFPWYAVQTKPKQECRAEQNLRVWACETFAPTISERSPLKIGTQTGYRNAPLFPGYIFARFATQQDLWRIRRTSGVHDVVTFGNLPARVDDDIIALLRTRVAESERQGPVPHFLPGEHVRIQDGPLRNLVGIFERELNGFERVAVLLSTIACRARTVLDPRSLARVNAQ